MPRVLFVDSKESVRSEARKIFIHAGHEVITAASMTDARALLAANDFDMAIVNRKLKDNDDQKESCDIRDKASKSPLQLKRY